MAATFGLLVTEDRGKNWYTICEQAFALRFLEGDPLLEIMPGIGNHDGIVRHAACKLGAEPFGADGNCIGFERIAVFC